MNLFETVDTIINTCKAQPNINTAYEGSVYDLNDKQDIRYGACVVTQRSHSEDEDNRTYRFYVFAVDRLLNDKSNRLEVQSWALDTLSNVFASLRQNEDFVIENINYVMFTERFDSECAGAYAEVDIITDYENYCSENYN